jgi:acyl-CoA synthetase (AMP-forming)/AMP-acid ligase II
MRGMAAHRRPTGPVAIERSSREAGEKCAALRTRAAIRERNAIPPIGVACPSMVPLTDPRARLVDARDGTTLTGADLARAVAGASRQLDRAPAGAVLCLVRSDAESVLRYLGALAAGRPAALLDRDGPLDRLLDVVARFAPAAVTGAAHVRLPPPYAPVDIERGGAGLWIRRAAPEVVPDPRLRLLLATSGSTGRPRLVRQSADGVAASAAAVVESLGIGPDDVAVTTLPLHYTYGLSVLHSHLLAGATIVLEGRGVLDPGFWETVDRYGVTTLAGVPHTFELLARKPWTPQRNPSVRVLTAAGGRLPDPLTSRFHEAMHDAGGRLYVMYGQTEAGSRICVLPPERLPEKLGSVGLPVPGIALRILDPGPDGVGEVECRTPAAMLGYADSAADLARGDDLDGVLRTGDSGRLDADGFLWLSGRLGRIGKAFGVRVNLDAVERVVAELAPSAAVAADDRVRIWCEGLAGDRFGQVVDAVTRSLGVHRAGVLVGSLDALPRLPSGKVDYRALPA